MAIPALQRVVSWLHAGYPEGVPPTDYYAVLALLARHLSEQEVIDAADVLALTCPSRRTPTRRWPSPTPSTG